MICEVQCIRPSEGVRLLVGGAVQQSKVSERSTAAKLPRGFCAQARVRRPPAVLPLPRLHQRDKHVEAITLGVLRLAIKGPRSL